MPPSAADRSLGLADVLARDDNWWSTLITDAVQQGWIAEPAAGAVDRLTTHVSELRRRHRLDPSPERAPASLGDLLRTLPAELQLTSAEQTVVAGAVDGTPGDLEVLPTRLREAGWVTPKIDGVLRTIGLGEVTLGHAPLVAALQREQPQVGDAALADLAGYSREDWSKLVDRHGVPAHLDTPPSGYVDVLMRGIEQRMPTTVVARRIADQRIPVADEVRPGVLRFLDKRSNVPPRRPPRCRALLRGRAGDREGIDDDQLPAVRDEVLRLERIVRVSPDLEAAERMLAAGYGSARQITYRQRRQFVDELSTLPGGRAAAEEIYDRASNAVAAATGLLLAHAPAFNRAPNLPVMPAPAVDDEADGTQVALRSMIGSRQTATLEALFGNQDYCACEGCASMYSPAAYLVELLQLLDGGRPNAAGTTALDVLLERRPDLGEIELHCDNTDVIVPYVDLVLEILESALAGDSAWNAFARGQRDAAGNIDDWGFDPELDQGRLPSQLYDDLAAAGVDVGETPQVTPLPATTSEQWRVAGNGWRLYLRGSNPARSEDHAVRSVQVGHVERRRHSAGSTCIGPISPSPRPAIRGLFHSSSMRPRPTHG